ncbi:MAG: DUF2344 domain-containing protein [Chloroflexi bacterium]|nr:DUF2344 domain-containing protein [Chloroflexota bacterium]
MNGPLQRLRVTFSRGAELKFITHLDLMRLWERALRRAGVGLAYSEGYTPHPRISLAAPLAVGVTSEGELMDVYLERRLAPSQFQSLMQPQLPVGIKILSLQEIGVAVPSLQSMVRAAEYRVEMESPLSPPEVEEAIAALLARTSLPWQHLRDTQVRQYDLRAQVQDLWLEGCRDGVCALGMRLKADPEGSGRPEQVAAALGLGASPARIHRTKLMVERYTPPKPASRPDHRPPSARPRGRPGPGYRFTPRPPRRP